MQETIETLWLHGMAFQTEINGHKIIMDASPSVGGKNLGPRPKPLLLAALGGCTSMDVISILSKMKVIPSEYKVSIDAELTEEHPKVYKSIHVTYVIKGPGFEGNQEILEKVNRAVDLSVTKYCGVSDMLSKAAEITHEICLLNE